MKKQFIENLISISTYLKRHDNIRTISIARNGVIMIVFDHGEMTEEDAAKRMEEYGIRDYNMTTDWRSDSIFVKFKK